MSYASIDIVYLEETEFSNERIFDFLDTTIPLCSVHQTKTVLTFFYLISGLIIYMTFPLSHRESSPLWDTTTFIPIIFTAAIHVLMTTLYIVFALFAGASIKACLGLVFCHHTIYPIVVGIGSIIVAIYGKTISLFFLALFSAISILLDIIIGVISQPSHKFQLMFESIGMLPCSILIILYKLGIVPHFAVYIPFCVFFIAYIVIIITLMKCCKPWNKCTYSFLSDPEIMAEFVASNDYESFWNSSYWRETQTRRRSDSDSSSSSSEAKTRESIDLSFLIDTNKRELKFPKKEKFQLYKLDTEQEKPFFISSLIVSVVFTAFMVTCLFNAIRPFRSFYYLIAVFVLLIFFTAILNSRAIGYNMCAITNINNDILDILWDHPSFSYVF